MPELKLWLMYFLGLLIGAVLMNRVGPPWRGWPWKRVLDSERVWRVLCAYEADGGSIDPGRIRRVARDDNGTPNVYNTLLLIREELFPERVRRLRDEMEKAGL